jgi:hypothetical protein
MKNLTLALALVALVSGSLNGATPANANDNFLFNDSQTQEQVATADVLANTDVKAALKFYKGPGSIAINGYLRVDPNAKAQIAANLDEIFKSILTLDRAFSALPPAPSSRTLYRAEPQNGRTFTAGAEPLQFSSYLSTSKDVKIADGFSQFYVAKNGSSFLFTIILIEGHKSIDFHDVNGGKTDFEREVLLPRNMRFEIISTKTVGKVEHVTLKQI